MYEVHVSCSGQQRKAVQDAEVPGMWQNDAEWDSELGERMKHYGDITKLDGAELPVVDVITGGSPCQDLSVAGKRAGLDGERTA